LCVCDPTKYELVINSRPQKLSVYRSIPDKLLALADEVIDMACQCPLWREAAIGGRTAMPPPRSLSALSWTELKAAG
jgi:hypothetical protein